MLVGDKRPVIIMHPRWHKAVYTVVVLIFVAFLYLVLDNLTDTVNATRDDLSDSNSVAVANADAVKALEQQVKGLGATPVVSASELPEPAPSEPGADGADGQTGRTGPAGPPGQSVVGPSGPPGASGAPGGTGAPGASTTGAAGPSGAPGATVEGPSGAKGDPGETVVGPAGPAGADGRDGKDGVDGQDGADGAQGPAGPACPEGYSPEERTFLTPSSPILGETFLVCAPNAARNNSNTRLVRN